MCTDGDVYVSAGVMFDPESGIGSSVFLRNAVGLYSRIERFNTK